MAHRVRGRLKAVVEQAVGSTLVVDLPAGSTQAQVGDAYPFEDVEGGVLAIGDETIEYVTIDDDRDLILLANGTQVEHFVGENVIALPASTEKTALVTIAGQPDAEVRVNALWHPRLRSGIRDPQGRERVRLRYEADEYVLDDVWGSPKLIDGSAIDPETTIPPTALTDGAPPSTSPAVQVIPGIDCVYLKIPTPTPNPDLVTYDYYGAGELLTSDAATLVSVSTLADGVTPLPTGVDTEFYVIARDADGPAATPGPSASGRPRHISTADLAQEIIDQIDASGVAADAAQAAADQALEDALAASAAAAAAQATANAAETPSGAQAKADAAQSAAGTYTDGQVATKGKLIVQVSAPTGANANALNLWIDISGTPPKNRPMRYDGTAWVAITDKVAADAALAAAAAQTAADAAAALASTAQATANGKNSNSFSGSATAPSTTGRVDGDIHTQFVSGVAVKQWQLVSGAWSVRKIDGVVLTNVDAASITTGLLNVAILIEAGAISTDKLAAEFAEIGTLYGREAYLGTVSANQITTGVLDAVVALLGSLNVGSLISVSPPTSTPNGSGGYILSGGIVIKDPANPNGEPLVRLHPMGCTFKGQMTADILTVLQNLIVNGSMTLGSGVVFTVPAGVSDPTVGPKWTVGGIEQQVWPVTPTGYTSRGLAWDGANSRWYETLEKNDTHRAYVRTVSTTGAPGSMVLVALPTFQSSGESLASVAGAVVVGSSLQVAVNSTRANGDAHGYMLTVTPGTGAVTTTSTWCGTGGTSGGSANDKITSLGAVQGGGYVVASTDNGNVNSVFYLNASFAFVKMVSLTDVAFRTNFAGGVLIGSFDFGAERVVGLSADGTARVYTATWSTSYSPSFPVGSASLDATKQWTMAGAFTGSKLAHNGNFLSLANGAATLAKFDTFYPGSSDGVWSAVYVDKSTSGSTKPSPATTATIAARQFATLTLADVPPGGVITSADVWVGYAASGDASTKYKRAESLSGRVMVLTAGKQTSGTTTIPTTNSAGGSPGKVKSETPGWTGHGGGQFEVADPLLPGDAANKGYVDTSQLTDYGVYVRTANYAVANSTGNPLSTTPMPSRDSGTEAGGVLWDATNSRFRIIKPGLYAVTLFLPWHNFGTAYRRRTDIERSDNGTTWTVLDSQGITTTGPLEFSLGAQLVVTQAQIDTTTAGKGVLVRFANLQTTGGSTTINTGNTRMEVVRTG